MYVKKKKKHSIYIFFIEWDAEERREEEIDYFSV